MSSEDKSHNQHTSEGALRQGHTVGPYIGLSPKSLALCSTEPARKQITLEKALQFQVLPLMVLPTPRGVDILKVVARNRGKSEKEELERLLRFSIGSDIELSWIESEELTESIIRAYLGSDDSVRQQFGEIIKSKAAVRAFDDCVPTLEKGEGDVAKLLTSVLHHAAVREASDLHLCPSSQGAILKLRVDGELLVQDTPPYPRAVHDQIVARIKVLSGLDVTKKHQPQDGAFTFTLPGGRKFSSRVSAIPTLHGESIVIRFLAQKELLTVQELGFTSDVKEALLSQLGRRGGLIVLAGPTGCGKSTTLYACLQEVRRSGRNIITVEDPIEQQVEGVSQIQVSAGYDFTYPKAIRAVLRHDPDALLIGEIRDSESASAALNASSTGHLTLTSLHLGSALDVLERFKALDVVPVELGAQLLMVVNQRLVPKLCQHCKVVDLACTRSFGTTVYQRVGCPSCSHSGYNGRVLVCEALIVEDGAVRDAISRGVSKMELLRSLTDQSWISWNVSLQHGLCRGEISAEQFSSFVDREYI